MKPILIQSSSHRLIDKHLELEEEIEEWQGLVEAMRETRESGGAAVSYQGGMVDIAHEKTAVEMLELAGKLGLLKSDI